MPNETVADDCRAEVETLHRFFVEWFSGTLPNTDETWSRLEDSLAPGFALVAPSGELLEQAPLLASLRRMHGHHGPETAFRIEVRDLACRHVTDDFVIATYVEWQTLRGKEASRVSTAVFQRDAASPRGLRWLHVHETWRP